MYRIAYYPFVSESTVKFKDVDNFTQAMEFSSTLHREAVLEIKHYDENSIDNRPTLWSQE